MDIWNELLNRYTFKTWYEWKAERSLTREKLNQWVGSVPYLVLQRDYRVWGRKMMIDGGTSKSLWNPRLQLLGKCKDNLNVKENICFYNCLTLFSTSFLSFPHSFGKITVVFTYNGFCSKLTNLHLDVFEKMLPNCLFAFQWFWKLIKKYLEYFDLFPHGWRV